MPAAAVIPALIVYISVVAVKTLVVGLWGTVASRTVFGLVYRPFSVSLTLPEDPALSLTACAVWDSGLLL